MHVTSLFVNLPLLTYLELNYDVVQSEHLSPDYPNGARKVDPVVYNRYPSQFSGPIRLSDRWHTNGRPSIPIWQMYLWQAWNGFSMIRFEESHGISGK